MTEGFKDGQRIAVFH